MITNTYDIVLNSNGRGYEAHSKYITFPNLTFLKFFQLEIFLQTKSITYTSFILSLKTSEDLNLALVSSYIYDIRNFSYSSVRY